MLYYGDKQSVYELKDKPLASGGEGSIYEIVGSSNLVAKIYHKDFYVDRTQQRKIVTMANTGSSAVFDHTAWPQDVLYDSNHSICGFTMQLFSQTRYLALVLSDSNVNWRQRIEIAYNLCVLVDEIHQINQCIGDMNPANFGVAIADGTNYVYAFDADSFHITTVTSSGMEYLPCVVGLAKYYAPELQTILGDGTDLRTVSPARTFTKETDRFALAVLIFQLLFDGYHPFTGAIDKSGRSSTYVLSAEKNVANRMSPFFNPSVGICAPPSAPPLTMIPKAIRDMFYSALLTNMRPTAQNWQSELIKLRCALKECPSDKSHYYYNELAACPWCELQNYIEPNKDVYAYEPNRPLPWNQ